ncbi:MAG: hypothetical protein SOT28_12995 [Fusicatenibacter sp.]|nr:hypothetical protein [Lachnospiraceae bacterium]MDY2939201.1 hypothetical protein [Fusicatenibacter sp.]
METVCNYLKRAGVGRILVMIAGNIFLGMGVGIFKLSGLGNDPFSGMVMALSDLAGIKYANFLILVNIVLFLIELWAGKKYIGVGTFVNALLLGYIATFFYELFGGIFGHPNQMFLRVITVCAGVIVCSFGVSMYQSSDVGVAPYDSLSLIMAERWPKISYFWHRMSNDAVCALICYFAGGIVGLGTLICAFGLGPFIHFFNHHFTFRLLKWIDRKRNGQKGENNEP